MKYIDADKLKAKIESIGLIPQTSADYNDGRNDMKIMFLDTIDSLQPAQAEPSKGKFVFPKILYARTTNNKTIDVSYVPQSLDAIEYLRKDALIEWVKEHKCVIEEHGDEGDAYLRGEYSLLNSLIDKLNLM